MPKIIEATAQAVARYAERFHAAVPEGHHVASPLGAWLLLALAGTAAPQEQRPEYAQVLGMEVADAAEAARALLEDPHPAVSEAAALWTSPSVRSESFQRWSGGLPELVGQGSIPDQAGADRWAVDHTAGMIERFPVPIRSDTVLVLATALATRIRWWVPFDLAPASELGGDFGSRLTTALRAPSGHSLSIVASSAGDLAVHLAWSDDGLAVLSVIADPGAGRRAVLAAAHEVAGWLVAGGLEPHARDLFELPLGDGPAWTLTESRRPGRSLTGRTTGFGAVLPAWEAATKLNLLADQAYGFHSAVAALVAVLGPLSGVDPSDAEAAQSAVARFGRYGFEAAAVTAVALQRGTAPGPAAGEVLHRQAQVRFAHPYAVVAVTLQPGSGPGVPGPRPWHGLPVFSAWVSEPRDAERD